MSYGPAGNRYSDSGLATTGATGAMLAIPGNVQNICVVAIPGGAESSTIQYCLDSAENVALGAASCTWIPWTPGAVTALTAQALLGSITGIRVVCAGGGTGCTFKIAGQRF
jgi:hypothetical protein